MRGNAGHKRGDISKNIRNIDKNPPSQQVTILIGCSCMKTFYLPAGRFLQFPEPVSDAAHGFDIFLSLAEFPA